MPFDECILTIALEASAPIDRNTTISLLGDDWSRVAIMTGCFYIQIVAVNALVICRDSTSSKIVRFALFEALHYPTSALGSLIGLDDVMERIMLNFNIVQFTL